ncbi:MAG: hypothetical protein OQK73_09510 [Gammaproteobacteria bacterium]|nr:hypothetical protein [Gammaproteobacteria bacterium]
MDRFTRNYLRVLTIIVTIAIIAWLFSLNPRVWELNNLLEEDPQLSNYPYQFKVLTLENKIATLTSPRSAEVSVMRFINIVYPYLRNKDTNNPEIIAVQKELAKHQTRAKELILKQPDVNQVIWKIDQSWYSEHGIILQ